MNNTQKAEQLNINLEDTQLKRQILIAFIIMLLYWGVIILAIVLAKRGVFS